MHSVEHLIDIALEEDIGPGDITTDPLIDPSLCGNGTVTAKEALVIAGLHVANQVFKRLDPEIRFKPAYQDGDRIEKGEQIFEAYGKLRALLAGERTALNFLQRLSGIATNVRFYAERLQDKKVRLVDTRKTTPGWRALEKYAVRVGGARNHRMGLYDGVLIKDNHIAVCGGIQNAVKHIRKNLSHLLNIEVEVSNRSDVEEALEADVDVIMLDNMDMNQIIEAVELIGEKALVEVSGGVTHNNLVSLADTGVDIISVGALTHAARCVDMSMRIIKAD